MKTNLGMLTIVVIALTFFGAIFACKATEISVPVMKMGNLSIDLGPDSCVIG
jgi:Cu/Ag efflux pump CusA